MKDEKLFLAVWSWNSEVRTFLVKERAYDHERDLRFLDEKGFYVRNAHQAMKDVGCIVGEGGKIDVFEVNFQTIKHVADVAEIIL